MKNFYITSEMFVQFLYTFNKFQSKVKLIKEEIPDYKSINLTFLIKNLIDKSILTKEQSFLIIKHMCLWRFYIYEVNEDQTEITEFFWSKEKKFPFKKGLNSFTKWFFHDANENFNFKQHNLSLYEINHNEELITILAVAPTSDIYKVIKNYKANSLKLREQQRVEVEYTNENGEKEIKMEMRTFEKYKIKIVIASLDFINAVYSYNSNVWEWITWKIKNINTKLKKTWINIDTNLDWIYVIEKGLDTDDVDIDTIVYQILHKQFEENVSDIHIEPLLDSTDSSLNDAWFVRYRIDWDLQWREVRTWIDENGKAHAELKVIIPDKYSAITNKIKEKSWISTNQDMAHLPWDWKLKVYIKDKETLLEYRVSSMPEWVSWQWWKDKIVMRKLERWIENLDLVTLNMDLEKRKIIDEYVGTRERAWRFNNGLILMTWPTGSWKSTTLFSILNQINKPNVNIQTLEDPIEYVIPWLNQSQIQDATTNDPDSDTYTYAKWIKACLRQDPDIILIWEIRDEITMDIAKEAAATWHLVFSSLHTNDTWQTLDRLEWIKFDLNLVWNIIRLIMAQRLCKVVCNKCRREYNDPLFSNWDSQLQIEREKEYLEMKMDIVRKLADTPEVLKLPNNVEDIKLYEWLGERISCAACSQKGTKWRQWVYEFLPTSSVNVSKFIKEHWTSVDNEKVKKDLFIPEWITTLHQNALLKTFNPNIDKKWNPLYISYHDAIAWAGADTYEWDKDYKNLTLKELNILLKEKKLERKYKINKNKIIWLDTIISSEEKTINKENKVKKEEKINILKKERDVLLNENKKIIEHLKILEVHEDIIKWLE